MARKVSKAGLELVKEFEGFYARAYKCPAGVWTIGYGHTKGVKPGQIITKSEAEEILTTDLDTAGEAVERFISVPLEGHQYAALVSFTFNVGRTNLRTSTLRKKLNNRDYDAVPSELNRWVKATVNGKKKTLKGLVRRRAAEGLLWMGGSHSDPTRDGNMPQVVEKA